MTSDGQDKIVFSVQATQGFTGKVQYIAFTPSEDILKGIDVSASDEYNTKVQTVTIPADRLQFEQGVGSTSTTGVSITNTMGDLKLTTNKFGNQGVLTALQGTAGDIQNVLNHTKIPLLQGAAAKKVVHGFRGVLTADATVVTPVFQALSGQRDEFACFAMMSRPVQTEADSSTVLTLTEKEVSGKQVVRTYHELYEINDADEAEEQAVLANKNFKTKSGFPTIREKTQLQTQTINVADGKIVQFIGVTYNTNP